MMHANEQSSPYLSSVEVARILDVNVATVKRWTESGKLDCIKTAGGHRKFLMRHLAAFAIDHQKYAQHLSLIPFDSQLDLELNAEILKAEFDKLIPYFLERATVCDYKAVQNVLNSLYMIHHDLAMIYDDLLTPILHEIGHLWVAGELSITQEHLASQAIRDGIVKLQEIVPRPEKTVGRAFVFTFSEELHDIPAKMVQHLLEVRGFQVLFSGQKTPTGDSEHVFETFSPDRVYLSSVYVEDTGQAKAELKKLELLCKSYDVQLYGGGAGLNQLITEDSSLHKLLSFRDVLKS